MKRVLILGHTSSLARRFRREYQNSYTVITAGRGEGADIHLSLKDAPPPVQGPLDCVINCIASFGDDPIEAEKTNVFSAIRAVEIARASGCGHVIDVSTIFAIDHAQNEYYGVYGLSKANASRMLALLCGREGIGYTTLRLSQLYDEAGEQEKHQPMFYRILRLAVQGAEEIVFYGKADPMRNYLYLGDAVEVLRRVIDGRVRGTYDCPSPQSVPQSQVARLAIAAAGTDTQIVFDESKPDLKTVYIPSGDALYERLGYAPGTQLEAGIQRTIQRMF